MATALIVINQAGKPAGIGGSRTDLTTGALVTLSNDDNTGVSMWAWTLLSVPPGSIATLATPSASTSTFTPDLIGSYRIRLTVNGSITDIAIAAVRTANLNIRIPATGEEDEYGSTIGWSKAMYDAFVAIDANSILGNTLDESYDEGGVGAGRSITADSGAVQINAFGNMALDLDGYVSLNEISDPTNITNQGFVYAKDISGITELFYMDDAGTITQITSDGYLDTFESVPGIGLFEQGSNPTPAADKGFVFTKDVGGTTSLFYMDETGTLSRLDGYANGGNTLDQAYDEGGAGVGRQITADSGAVEITSTATGLQVNFNSAGFGEGILVDTDHGGNDQVIGFRAVNRDTGGSLGPLESTIAIEAEIEDSLSANSATLSAFRATASAFGPGSGLLVAYDTNPFESFRNWDYVLRGNTGGGILLQGNDGYMSMRRASPEPGPQGASLGTIYIKSESGDEELMFRDGSGNYEAVQITQDGYVNLEPGYLPEIMDPAARANFGFIYSKDDAGDTELFYMDSNGNAVQITQDGSVVSSGGTGLVDGYLPMQEIVSDPPIQDGYGSIYTKDDGGVTEFFYTDDVGNVLQISYDGYQFLNPGFLIDTVDPTPAGNGGYIYVKDVIGTSQLFFMDSDGSAIQLTPVGVTLDAAYDFGGAGAGRSITADAGAVIIDASGDDALELDGYILLNEIIDPTNIPNKGFVYTKNDDAYGTSELFYMDDTGQVTQITQDGYLATYNSLRGIRLLEGVELPNQPGSLSLYAKDSNGVTELFSRDSSGSTTQITQDGSLKGWSYLPNSLPSGAPGSIEALYQFDKTASELNDRSGNGHTLTVFDGTRYYTAPQGLIGISSRASVRLRGPDTEDLRIAGAITIEVICAPRYDWPNDSFIFVIGAVGESLATNNLYSLLKKTDRWHYAAEEGAGVNINYTTDAHVSDSEDLMLVTLTRDASGDIKFYLNGQLISTASLNPPQKDVTGNQQRLFIFGDDYTHFYGTICSMRITSGQFSDAQVLEAYRQVKGF